MVLEMVKILKKCMKLWQNKRNEPNKNANSNTNS